jgi:hypothetical protein
MIKEFDKKNLNTLRADFDQAIAEVAKKHGIVIRLGNIRYDSVKATSKVEFAVTTAPDGTTTANSQEALRAADFSRYAASFGLKPDQYGAIIKHGRESYKLVGFSPRSTRFPILATRLSDGKTFKLPESAIVGLQSKDHKDLFGITSSPTVDGMCSNDNAYDDNWKNIGKCNRPAVTNRKEGFGRSARMQPFCAKCASMIDEARAENAAEARMS